jgi:hypothetical protein
MWDQLHRQAQTVPNRAVHLVLQQALAELLPPRPVNHSQAAVLNLFFLYEGILHTLQFEAEELEQVV